MGAVDSKTASVSVLFVFLSLFCFFFRLLFFSQLFSESDDFSKRKHFITKRNEINNTIWFFFLGEFDEVLLVGCSTPSRRTYQRTLPSVHPKSDRKKDKANKSNRKKER